LAVYIVYSQTSNLQPPPQCQSRYQIAATPLMGQQIQRPAPSAPLAAATCEADRVLQIGFSFFEVAHCCMLAFSAKAVTHMNFDGLI